MCAATIKKFDINDHDQVAEKQQAVSRAKEELNIRMNEGEMCDEVAPVIAKDKESMEAMTAAELTENPGLLNLRHRIQIKQADPGRVDVCKPHSQPRVVRITRSGIEEHKEQAATREHRY